MSPAAPARIGSLDSLRGVAILMVVLSHYLAAQLAAPALTPHLQAVGRGGVILFFLLSGYLIYRNVERQPLGIFLSRRLFKILPSYWLNLAILFALDLGLTAGEHHPARSYLTDFLMVSDIVRQRSVSGVYWTLLIEIKFYVFIALQYALLRGRGMAVVLAGLVGLAAAAAAVRGQGSQLLAFFPVFYVGIYLHRAEAAGWQPRSVAALAMATAAAAASAAFFADEISASSAVFVLAGAGVFLLCLRTGFAPRWLGFFGATSYSNYLYHAVIGAAVFRLVAPGYAFVAAFVLATAAAALMFRLVEQPLVRFGRLTEAMRLRPGPAPAI